MAIDARYCLDRGARLPYDALDKWLELPEHDEIDSEGPPPPPPVDWAHAAARGVVQELKGRSGLDDILGQLDEETRVEIVSKLAEIIRLAEQDRHVMR